MQSSAARRSLSQRSLTSVAVLCLSAVLLVGCGGVKGTYSHESKLPDGSVAEVSLELRGGGKAVMSMMGMNAEGTYTVDGDKISVTISGDTTVWTRSGNKLSSPDFGEDVTLVKE